MQQPLCSIIIPTYNHGKYIERSLQCALDQTYPNVEIIVVDDGSTDDTGDRLKPFGSRIVYLRKENGGLGAARNSGIRIARGDYLQFLDADDSIRPEKLERQVEILEANKDVALVYSDCRNTDLEGNQIANISYPLETDEDPIHILVYRVLTSLNACLTRRAAVVDIGMFDECRHAQEDWDYWIRLRLRGHKIKYSPGDFVHYDNTGSEMTSDPVLMYKRTIHLLTKFLHDKEFNQLGHQIVKNFVAHQNHHLAMRAYNNQWWVAAREHFLATARADSSVMARRDWSCIPKTYLHQILDRLKGRQAAAAP